MLLYCIRARISHLMSQTSPRVMVFGTFDLLHEGHRFVLRKAMERGDVIVIVAQDQSVERIKGRKPAQHLRKRMEAIRTSFPMLHVEAGDCTDFLKPVKTHTPDLILLGYDQRLPPGVEERHLSCPIERLPAFDPHLYKSSLKRKGG